MIRNIDKMREKGVLIEGPWFNKNVLMLNEAINSTMNASKVGSPERDASDNDSIFNIELSNQAV